MASYFSNVPNFDYISRGANAKNIGDYITTKNLFRRVKLRDDVINTVTYFTDYNIFSGDRPDNVAARVYEDENLDWLILLANNIINVYDEWPLSLSSFDAFVLDKYGTYDNLNGVHHYETIEVLDTSGSLIVPQGARVPANFSITYFDLLLGGVDGSLQTATNITYPVTNLEYEQDLQEKKGRIRIIKPEYLNLVYDDIDKIMPYKEGSTQYVSRSLKRGENLRIFSF
jgi:hypothetical protein